MSGQATLKATQAAISSPASAAGRTLFDLPDGRTLAPHGAAPVRVSRSPRSESAGGFPTIATFGPSGSSLSESAVLQASLESKLRALLTGSPLCEVIWKEWPTPWGACLSKPRARMRTIAGTDFGLWPTARANKWGVPDSHGNVSMWPTPTTSDYKNRGYHKKGETWWASVPGAAGAATIPSYPVPTADSGALNPEFVCWLMGYPTEWVSCGASVTRSIRARPPRSSKPPCTP